MVRGIHLMMKRMVCVLMACLVLALPTLCLAQETGYETYNDPDGRFSFLYPDDWTLLSKETIDEIMNVATELGDENLAAVVESVKPQLEMVDMVMLMGPDAGTNINVVCQDTGMELSADTLLALSGTLQSQLSAQLEGLSFIEEPSLIDVGDGQALLLQYAYSLAGQDLVGVQAYRSNGSDLYIFTLTTSADLAEGYAETFGFVLGSTQFQ